MESTSVEDEITISCEEATAEFCGSLVRLDCGTDGVYQGIVLKVDPANAHIKIERPFRNGTSLDNQVVQIPGELIKEVLVIRTLLPPSPSKEKEVEEILQRTEEISLEDKTQKDTPKKEEEQSKTNFVGYLANVYSTNSPDIYQGKIMSVDAKEHSIRLETPLL